MRQVTHAGVQYYLEGMRAWFSGRRLVVAVGPLASATRLVATLRDLGVAEVAVIADGVGTGALPNACDFPWVDVRIGTQPDSMATVHAYQARLAALPDDALAFLQRWDPEQTASVIASRFSTLGRVAGRRRLGRRLPAWEALEDKCVVDSFFDRHAVPRPPSQVVGLEANALWKAHTALNRGDGTVWSGDVRDGFNGGATRIRWVSNPVEAETAQAFLLQHCDRVRVSPFVEGIPCSVHGIVFADTIAVFRPCEMMVFRRPGEARFEYCGAATFWDPPDAERDRIREFTRRVGHGLKQDVGFRGAFTVDGIIGADGFVATEVNTRTGGAFRLLASGLPEINLELLNVIVMEGAPFDWRAETLERLILEVADAHRAGGGWLSTRGVATQTRSYVLNRVADGWQIEEGEGPADAIGRVGPSATGSHVRVTPDPDRTPKGPSAQPLVAELLGAMDDALDLGIGRLTPAQDLSLTGR